MVFAFHPAGIRSHIQVPEYQNKRGSNFLDVGKKYYQCNSRLSALHFIGK